MPLTWLRRPARLRKFSRPLTPRRRTALAVEGLEDRALMSATMFQEIVPHNPLGQTANLTNVNGSLVFTVDDGATGTELWKTDGTAPGTVHLHDFPPNASPGASGPRFLTNVNGTLYFAVNNSSQAGLWKTDGTPDGTVEVAPFKYLDRLTAFNNSLYFSGVGTTGGPALWKSDGTAAGTVDVQNVAIYSPLTAANGSLSFSGADLAGVHGAELWKSDGTTAGTVMLKEIAPGPVSSNPYDLTAAHNELFFEVSNPLGQSGLWASTGSSGGTVRLQQAVPYSPADLADVNGTLFFLNAGPTNPGLWKSDGTPGGTGLVSPIGNDADATVSLTAFQGNLYYLRQTAGGPSELWKSDGTAAGTVKVTTLPAAAAPAGNLTNVNGTLFFTANDGAGGFELWKSDGTAAGTILVEDIAHAGGTGQLANVNGVLYFTAGDGQGTQLWKYDPASGPTALAGGPYTLYAGETAQLDGHNSTGASPLIYAWTVNGHALPGSPGQATLSLNWAALVSYGVTGPGTYPVTLGVADAHAGISTSATSLILRSPLVNLTGTTASATEGAAFTATLGTFKDPAGAQPVSTYNAQVDWGDGTAPSILAVVSTPRGFVVSGGHTYAEEGTYTLTVNVEKGGGLPNSVKTTVKVGDAPIWAGRQFLRAPEGRTWAGTVASITDGSPQGKVSDCTATIHWGDGTSTPGTVTLTAPGKFAVQGGHTYAAAATYSVTVSVADVGGATATATSTFLVDDAALTAVAQKVWSTATPALVTTLPTLVAGFADANPLATAAQFSATIDWGDGTTSTGTVAHAAGQPFFVVSGEHIYTNTVRYKVTTTILDAGGSSLKTTSTLQGVALPGGKK